MDRLSAALACRVQDFLSCEIAFMRCGGAGEECGIGFHDERRGRVGFGIDGDAAYAEKARGADDAARDFPAIGDQDGGEHAHYIRNRPKCGLGGMGALSAAEMARPSTSRVCAGSMMPSSQSRAVAK